MKIWKRLLLILCLAGALGAAYWKFAIPTHRIDIRSELVMLGDLDYDRRWTAADLAELDVMLAHPFEVPASIAWRNDMRNMQDCCS